MTASPSSGDRLRARLAESPLYVIVTFDGPVGPTWDALLGAARGGARLFQIRAKHADTSALRYLLIKARQLLADVLGPPPLLIVNDDLAAARDVNGRLLADGVHVGREDAARLVAGARAATAPDARTPAPSPDDLLRQQAVGLAEARQFLGAELLLGTSARTLAEVRAAEAAGCDYAGFGAIAPSFTKRDTRPADLRELARCVRESSLPLYAIGGIDTHIVTSVVRHGCTRVAVGGAILGARDAERTTRALLETLARA